MKFRLSHPDFENFSDEEFIDKVPYDKIIHLFMKIADYYNKSIPFWRVLQSLGIYDVDQHTEESQVSCMLIEHGSADSHKSARYFSHDRDTGEYRPAIYCYKCNKLLTTFWFLYKYEKDNHGLNSKEIFKLISSKYKIPFPRELVLDFDPDTFFSFDENSEENRNMLKGFEVAAKYRQLKVNPELYCEKLGFLMRGELEDSSV